MAHYLTLLYIIRNVTVSPYFLKFFAKSCKQKGVNNVYTTDDN